jgi:hypothetical protein
MLDVSWRQNRGNRVQPEGSEKIHIAMYWLADVRWVRVEVSPRPRIFLYYYYYYFFIRATGITIAALDPRVEGTSRGLASPICLHGLPRSPCVGK